MAHNQWLNPSLPIQRDKNKETKLERLGMRMACLSRQAELYGLQGGQPLPFPMEWWMQISGLSFHSMWSRSSDHTWSAVTGMGWYVSSPTNLADLSPRGTYGSGYGEPSLLQHTLVWSQLIPSDLVWGDVCPLPMLGWWQSLVLLYFRGCVLAADTCWLLH